MHKGSHRLGHITARLSHILAQPLSCVTVGSFSYLFRIFKQGNKMVKVLSVEPRHFLLIYLKSVF